MAELFAPPSARFCLDCDRQFGPAWEKNTCLCGKKLVSKEEKVKEAIKAAKKRK